MKSNFLNAGAIVSAAFIVAVAPSARAENFHAHYSVSLIGLPIGAATADAAIGQSAYKIDFSVKLTGLAAMVSSAKAALASSGSVNHGVVTPLTYATTSANSRETRTLRMALNGGSVRAVEYSPPWEDKSPDRVPLTEADKRNIIDPLSAFIMPVPAQADLVGPSACNRTVPVYDGYTRFDVTLSFVAVRQIKTKGYAGPVSVCAARYIPIAGHKLNRAIKFMEGNRQMDVWLAPMTQAHVVIPYRVSLMTMAGTAVIEATDMNIAP